VSLVGTSFYCIEKWDRRDGSVPERASAALEKNEELVMEMLPAPTDSNHNERFGQLSRGHADLMAPATETEPGFSLDVPGMIRKNWWLLLGLMFLGAGIGFASVVISSPMYKARVLLELQSVNEAFLKNTLEGGFEANDINIETQVVILRSGSFLKRGADRLQSDTVPLTPVGKGLFARIRQKFQPADQDPLESVGRGIKVAMATFNAQPVNRTKLIELTCNSTNPDVAAQFLNSMAAEFVEDTSQSRMQTTQKTSEWLAAQVEETKSRVADAEERLQEFVRASGNVFAGQEATLDDTKLSQLKMELAKSQSERIAKQTRYELVQKSPPETLGEVLDDETLQGFQSQLAGLRQQRAALLTTLTPKNDKVRKLDAQISVIESSYKTELGSVLTRLRNDYEAASRHEKLLASAHAVQSQRVGAEAGKAGQYNALKREVETLRQNYQTLLAQSNQASMNSSIPATPIRIVEAAMPAEIPYSPVPALNISMGMLLGGVLAAGLAFLRERLDRSIKSPSATRRFMNVAELGVIPNIEAQFRPTQSSGRRGRMSPVPELRAVSDSSGKKTWEQTPEQVAESFRGALASILRSEAAGRPQRVILVTSPGPGEGKTTVVQNLGMALAETGRNVLLVDGDFRRPHLHLHFSLSNETGLIDLIPETLSLSDCPPDVMCLPTGVPGLSVLPNRVTEQNVSKALYSPRLRVMFQSLRSRYDMILVDAPPILMCADARILGSLTDATILVLRCGVTDQERASEAHQLIKEDRLHLLGTVLTDWSGSKKSRYYYGYTDKGRS
jgi:succinoglycan biosynthesis transport protein ExoP